MGTTSDRAGRQVGVARRAVLDTNVLVPNALRDTLLRAAEAGLYDAHWSATTLVELERTLLTRILPDHPARAERVRRLLTAMHVAFPAATVPEDWDRLERLTNAPEDRHVLAAEVQSGSRIIVTANVRDFPAASLAPYGIAAQPPDRFLRDLFRRYPTRLIALLTTQGADLRNPRTLDAILDTLVQHTPTFVAAVRAAGTDVGR